MVRILRMLRNVFRDFHHAELVSLRNSAFGIIFFPFVLLLVGAFLGSISWTAKVVIVELELYFVTFFLLWLSWRRLIIGTEIAALLKAENFRSVSSLKTIKAAVNDYITLIAAILASELAAGYIVLWLPVHQNYLLSFLAITSVMALISHTIWRGGEFWWPKLVYKLAVFTLIVSLNAIIMPQTMRFVGHLIEGTDAKIVGGLECLENSNLPQCQKAVLISISAPTAISPIEEFFLKVGEPVQTVEAGPGTHHRIQSDKKFIAVSIQPDGSEKRYEMPAGTSYLNGRAPWGRILLEGIEDGTRVKIAPIN